VDARKAPLNKSGALKLAAQVERIVSTRGKKIVELDLKNSKPDDQAVAELVVGPSGNLRAPAARVGKTLLVGFDEGMYAKELG